MKTGLMRLLENPRAFLRSARVGVIANATTVDSCLRHVAPPSPSTRRESRAPVRAGAWALWCVQDMIDVADARDPWTGLSARSLYGHVEASLSPRAEDLKDLDVLIFDVQTSARVTTRMPQPWL